MPALHRKPQSLRSQQTVIDHVGALPNHLHKPWREVVVVLPAV